MKFIPLFPMISQLELILSSVKRYLIISFFKLLLDRDEICSNQSKSITKSTCKNHVSIKVSESFLYQNYHLNFRKKTKWTTIILGQSVDAH